MSTSKVKAMEFIVYGSTGQKYKLGKLFPAQILGNPLVPTQSVKILGLWFNSDCSMSSHVRSICRNCLVQLREFRRVRHYLTTEVSIVVANALNSSHVDYCNQLFRSLSKLNLPKLQSSQNSAACIVTNMCKFCSATPVV